MAHKALLIAKSAPFAFKPTTAIAKNFHTKNHHLSWYGITDSSSKQTNTASIWKAPSNISNTGWYGVDGNISCTKLASEDRYLGGSTSLSFLRPTSPAMFRNLPYSPFSAATFEDPFLRFSPLVGTNENRVLVDSMIRVDHSGEYAAQKIYKGQLLVLGRSDCAAIIREMKEQEEHHLRVFEDLMVRYRARPSILLPLWHVAGVTLGAATSLLGKEGAMACTVAVETVITEHYNDQLRVMHERQMITDEYAELRETIKKFRDDEEHHHDIGLKHEAEKAPFYSLLNRVIQSGCRAAIWLASRI